MTTREAFLKSFTTNVISVHTFTETFIDLILKSPRARIVFVTSGIGSLTTHSNPNFQFNQSPPAGWPKPYQLNNTTYRTSKTAMNMMALGVEAYVEERQRQGQPRHSRSLRHCCRRNGSGRVQEVRGGRAQCRREFHSHRHRGEEGRG